MTKLERLTLLEEFKTKDWFILDEWEDRELTYPGEDVVKEMKEEVLYFTNFLMVHLDKNTPDLKDQTEQFFKDWNNEDFDQDQSEFIIEVEYEAMRLAGLDVDELMI
ncbi:hypothetical protein EGI22_21945 [Lacihabitans sp. LS3-19]|uniref:hypothetical protein n=1 Tax=Lacihabitans sp. LS3-19 TaxID=2487335 RepID=UPI0020CE0988|nr:hypothetical protein [Lacihabitans sp. LS3-19]MCP9770579.1 hypothetical protein [Lacihabitans sp. LS3-19]